MKYGRIELATAGVGDTVIVQDDRPSVKYMSVEAEVGPSLL